MLDRAGGGGRGAERRPVVPFRGAQCRLPDAARPGGGGACRRSRAWTCPNPDGAFYVYPSFPGLIGPDHAGRADDRDRRGFRAAICSTMRRVAAVFGAAFGLRPTSASATPPPTRCWPKPAAASAASAKPCADRTVPAASAGTVPVASRSVGPARGRRRRGGLPVAGAAGSRSPARPARSSPGRPARSSPGRPARSSPGPGLGRRRRRRLGGLGLVRSHEEVDRQDHHHDFDDPHPRALARRTSRSSRIEDGSSPQHRHARLRGTRLRSVVKFLEGWRPGEGRRCASHGARWPTPNLGRKLPGR